jgi:hypothetical protein
MVYQRTVRSLNQTFNTKALSLITLVYVVPIWLNATNLVILFEIVY